MKTLMLMPVALAMLAGALPAYAEKAETSPAVLQSKTGQDAQKQVPELADIPVMQEQGKRMAALMDKIQEIKDPAERKRILAEAVCPQ